MSRVRRARELLRSKRDALQATAARRTVVHGQAAERVGCEASGVPPRSDDPLRRVANQLAGRAQVELLAHVAAVRIDGLHRQVQALRDLARADALADQPEHFQLALGERRDRIFVRRRVHARARPG